MKRLSRLSLIQGLMLACALASLPAQAEILLENARVLEVPPVSRNSAAYLSIRNTGDKADALLAVSSPAAEVVELHDMNSRGGLARMSKLALINIPAGQRLDMAPGAGKHIMLIGLKASLRAGEHIPLTLQFRDAGTLTVEAAVIAVGAAGTHHHH